MNKEELIKRYYKDNNLECPNMYCKDCGKLLIYNGADIRLNKNDHTKLIYYGHTFLSTKEFNNKIYHLSRCKECVAKKFPAINNIKFLYAQKASKYTQYAYDVSDEGFNVYSRLRLSITKDKMIKNMVKLKALNAGSNIAKSNR